jgi:hypothetical protein
VLRDPITLSAEQGLNFVQRELAGLSSFFRFDTQAQPGPVIEPAVPEVTATFEGSLNQLGAKIQCRYGQRIVTLGITSPFEEVVYMEGDKMGWRTVAFERDLDRFVF